MAPAVATTTIFAPGLLLTAGLLAFWHPVVTTGIHGPFDAIAAIAGVLLLIVWRPPPILVRLALFLTAARNPI